MTTITTQKPEIGMGATIYVGSDRYAGTVVGMTESRKTIYVTTDIATPAEGFDYYSNQVYTYETNAEAEPQTYTLRKGGMYVRKGHPATRDGVFIVLGTRRFYQDPSF